MSVVCTWRSGFRRYGFIRVESNESRVLSRLRANCPCSTLKIKHPICVRVHKLFVRRGKLSLRSRVTTDRAIRDDLKACSFSVPSEPFVGNLPDSLTAIYKLNNTSLKLKGERVALNLTYLSSCAFYCKSCVFTESSKVKYWSFQLRINMQNFRIKYRVCKTWFRIKREISTVLTAHVNDIFFLFQFSPIQIDFEWIYVSKR